jgi:hypothetical protein
MSLYAAAKRGQTTVMVDGEPVAIKDRIKFLQNEFKNKTGYRLGGFKIDAKGKPYIEPTAPRIPDIKNPVNTVLRQTLQGLGTYRMPGQEAIKITNAFDKAIQKAKTVNERVELFKKWKGKPELLNSRYIKATESIPRLKNLVKLLTTGTIALGGMTALAQADTGVATDEGITFGDVGKGAGAVTAGAVITSPKKAWDITKKVGSKIGTGAAAVGSPAAVALGWMPYNIKTSLEEGKSIPEAVANPWNFLELAFMDTLSKAATLDKPGVVRKFLRLGLNPKTISTISKRFGIPGLIASTGIEAVRGMPEEPSYIRESKQRRQAKEDYYTEGEHFAGGGLANLTRTVAPDSGLMSQGLRSLYIDDMD